MSIELIAFIFFFTGLLSGLLGGLLGIGGGMVTVPILYYTFLHAGIAPEKMMHLAVGTSLAAAFVTSLTSALIQINKKAIRLATFRLMVPTLILGGVAGRSLPTICRAVF